MNTEKTLLENENPTLSKGDVSGSLSYDEADGMTWGQVVRYWKPDATNDEVEKIYDEMYKLAYKDAILSRRDGVYTFMIFDRIKYTYFRELNCH